MSHKNPSSLIWPLIVLVLSGCGLQSLSGENDESGDIAAYVESVFKLQNRITSEVMALTSTGNVDDPQLLLAEKAMQGACLPLNQYAARESDGLSTGLFLRRRVQMSATACEHSARQLEALLNR